MAIELELIVIPLVIATILISPVLVMLSINILKRYRQEGGLGRLLAGVVALGIAIAFVLASMGVGLTVHFKKERSSLEYEIDLIASPTAEGIAYIPAPQNGALRDVLETRGDAEMAFVNIHSDEALSLAFKGNASVHGRIEGHGYLGDPQLTMMDTEHRGDAWVGLELQGNGTQAVSIELYYHSSAGNEAEYWMLRTPLQGGWNLYVLEHTQT